MVPLTTACYRYGMCAISLANGWRPTTSTANLQTVWTAGWNRCCLPETQWVEDRAIHDARLLACCRRWSRVVLALHRLCSGVVYTPTAREASGICSTHHPQQVSCKHIKVSVAGDEVLHCGEEYTRSMILATQTQRHKTSSVELEKIIHDLPFA